MMNSLNRKVVNPPCNNRNLRIMKTSFFILFLTFISVSANTHSQKTINLDVKNMSIKNVFAEIEKNSEYRVLFSGTIDKELEKTVSIEEGQRPLNEILDLVVNNTNLEYKVMEKQIVVYKPSGDNNVEKPLYNEFSQTVLQQNKTINVKGIVIEKSTKYPLPGAVVIVKGTQRGVETDLDGRFEITVEVGQELGFILLGMKSVEVKVTEGTTNLEIQLEDDLMTLDEFVVNGIFERKANTHTGSVITLSNDDLKRVGNSNVLQSLKNLDPSVYFISDFNLGSDPNSMPSLVIRGESSIPMEDTDLRAMYQHNPNAPLFVLDGFEASIQKIMDLDMNRVESLTILRDASAKAIYGSKAANGVIVIELKKNPESALRLSYNASIEIQAPDLTSYNLTNAAEKLEIEKAFGMYDTSEASFNNARMMNKLYNQKLAAVVSGIDTDWLAKPLQLGVGTKHGISVELGEDKLRAIVDLSYNKVEGVMKGSDRRNIAGGVTLTYRHKKFIFRNQLNVTSNESNDSKYGSFSEYARLNPYYTPFDQYGNISQNIVPQLDAGNDVMVNAWYRDINFIANPLYNANLQVLLQSKYIDVTNNFDFQWFIVDGIKATTRFGITEQRSRGDDFYPADHLKFQSYTGDMAFRKGSYNLEQGEQSSMTGKFDLQYNKEISQKNYIYLNSGLDISQTMYATKIYMAEGFPSDKMNDIIFARQYVKDSKPTGREQSIRDFGYYVSLNYSYDNRINLDGTFRQSASSLYGANSRWGEFWSLGTSWNIDREKWFNSKDITQLRVRATVGSTGSQSSGAYNALASYQYFLDRTYEGFLGAQLISMKNETLKWQQKLDQNLAIDLNFKNRYSISLEVYQGATNNAVNPLTLVPSVGFNTIQENIGKINNKGFDLRSSFIVWQRPSERSYLTLSLMLSRNKNILEEISEAMRDFNERQNDLALTSNRPVRKYYDGVSMNAIWAMKSLGIDPANGREIYLITEEDGTQRRTYEYLPAYQVICGDGMPKIHGNTGLSFQYKGFGFNTVFSFQYGGQIYNQTLVDKVENANMNFNVDHRIYTERWRQPGDHSKYKALSRVYISERDAMASPTTQATSRFVEDLNELRASSFQISYDFYRHSFVKEMGIERIVARFNVNDLFTISSLNIERGISYPFARTFNASFTFTL